MTDRLVKLGLRVALRVNFIVSPRDARKTS